MSDIQDELPEEVVVEEVPVKRRRGRPRKQPPEDPPEKKPRGRPRVENPCTAGHPKDPDYYKNYYAEKLKGTEIPCPRCGVMYSKVNLTNHKRTNKCVRHVQINDLKSQLAVLTEKLNAM
jgi:ribosomal protein L24